MNAELKGPLVESRTWLISYLADGSKFKNDVLLSALEEDWSNLELTTAAYILGSIWGRLRQNDSLLEGVEEYKTLLRKELTTGAHEGDKNASKQS